MKFALAILCILFSSCNNGKQDMPKRNKITRYPTYNEKVMAAKIPAKTEKTPINDVKKEQIIKPEKIYDKVSDEALIETKSQLNDANGMYQKVDSVAAPIKDGYSKRQEINAPEGIYSNDNSIKVIDSYPSDGDVNKARSMTLFSDSQPSTSLEKPRFEQRSTSYDDVPAKYLAKRQDDIDFRQKFRGSKSGSYYIVVGETFDSQYRADIEKKRLMRLSDQPVVVRQDASGYLVALGPFESQKNAAASALRIAKLGYDNIAVASKMP